MRIYSVCEQVPFYALLKLGTVDVLFYACLLSLIQLILNICCRVNAEEALEKLNGSVIGKQTVRLSWGRNPAKQVTLLYLAFGLIY